MEQYFSAPGRVELGGNHTDHQHGCVLAAAVDLEMRAAVTPNHDGVIRVFSQGFAPVEVALGDWTPRPEERNTTAALVRGMAAQFIRRGAALTGLDMRVTSQVPVGSGLSSSAAFEVLLGRVFSGLCCGGSVSPEDIARMGQTAERDYFGKPCGLMDQMASSVGGLVYMDFADPVHPAMERIDCDLGASGYGLFIVDSGADHADLTADYAAIPAELEQVCRVFGAEVLRQVDETEFYRRLPAVRAAAGDRAALRAIHVFDENRRAAAEAEALRKGDFPAFLALVNASGASSWQYLQNVTSGDPRQQALAVTLAVCRRALGGQGAVRVHGGGFAGTALAFVPDDRREMFRRTVEQTLGVDKCRLLSVRNPLAHSGRYC
ncbi:MAG: galactokinase family protein [Oscillospiraceae bacterium]|nr:galactokinase family protein [Oscillospiraceae bacterium]